MQPYELHRLKLGGTIAAQTPSSASAPHQLETLVGADTRESTATNQGGRMEDGTVLGGTVAARGTLEVSP